MKKLQFLVLLFFTTYNFCVSAQQKIKFQNVENVLSKINPDTKTDFWALVYNEYGRNKEIRTFGKKTDYLPQFSGFNLRPGAESFYYIVYSHAGKVSYITKIEDVKPFIGKINNAEEAALVAVCDGYLIDESFVDLAANYYEDKSNYYLDLGKVTATECPYQKKHFTLTIDKATGKMTNVKENGTYIEVYNKKCANNPRLLKIEKKEEPKEDNKKQPAKKRR